MVKPNKIVNEVDEKFRQSLEMLSTIYDLNPDAIALTRVDDGKIIDCNQEYLNQIGYSREEVIGHTTLELNLYSSKVRNAYVEEIKKNNTVTNFELRIKRKDDIFINVLYSARFITVNGEKILLNIGKVITNSKQIAETIQQQAELIDLSFDAIIVGQYDGTIESWNHGAEELYGYSKTEAIGKPAYELLNTIFTVPWSRIQKEIYNGGIWEGELKHQTKNGQLVIVSSRIQLIKRDNGSIKLLETNRDITERKRFEEQKQKLLENEQQLTEELQTSNEELQAVTKELQVSNEELQQQRNELSNINQALLDSERRMNISQEIAHLGGWELDLEKNTLSWSDEVYRIFGLQPQEFDATYEAFLDAVHPDDRTMVDEAYSGSIREGRDTYEIEHRVVRKSTGEVRIVHEKCQHFRDESGKIIRSVGMVQDITELKKAKDALSESEDLFRLIFHQSPIGSTIVSLDYKPLQINNALSKILGYSKEELLLNKFPEYAYPEDLELDIEQRKLLDSGLIDNFVIEKRFIHKNGQIVQGKLYVSAIKDQSGKTIRFLSMLEDITKRKVYEQQLKETLDKLEYSNKELEYFAYVASHDLREPLRMITSFLQLLERRYKDQLDQDANEFIDFAVEGAKRLDIMINDLLEYSKITSKELEFSPVNLENVLEEALINLVVQTEENNTVVTNDPLPTVSGDKLLLVQLFQNLIANAIKYHSQETPKIHISSKIEENQYIISFKDNGIGIDPKQLERIFTIFQRLHRNDEYEGTGIGLAIAQNIVTQHGGQIWAESELRKGTTFYFTIPETE